MISDHGQGWLDGVGDYWYENNLKDLGKRDFVSDILERTDTAPTAVLEVGCSNGWLLKKLRAKYGCKICGVDPSKMAIEAAGEPERFRVGLSTNLPVEDSCVDMVIMGYCLWATPPEDWFKTVAEADRVLADDGHLVIFDYIAPRFTKRKYCKREEDGKDYYQFYYDWAKLWLCHPGYILKGEMMASGTHGVVGATLIQKHIQKIPALIITE